ncbi:1492_t:CDS:2 [Cetraspora pellucida]|uniref:1492_t:CDS:1 n=1 Tax=Cetraspora pellucida TaxID=1433469 RepID=A0A9N9GHB9_9GLOM|nr:1492_t:CDS:2 [Cetraspora pellucida]
MFRSARLSLQKKKGSLNKSLNKNGLQGGGSLKRSITTRKVQRDVAEFVTLEEVHLIVKRCADEIRARGLHEVDIFKPVRIGDNIDDIRHLISCMLQEDRTQFEDEVKEQNIHNVVSAMKWALRHSSTALVPYQYYEEFVRYEQEWDYDPSKGSFRQFLCYLPKQNQEILTELFEVCSQVTAESHINKMSVQRLVKSLALCILSDQDKSLQNFDSAYSEWKKCSSACLHLFLAYLRELDYSSPEPLNPRLTILLDNYVEYRKMSVTSAYFEHPLPDTTVNEFPSARSRKQSIVTFAQTTEITTSKERRITIVETSESRPVSMLRVTRQRPSSEITSETRTFKSRTIVSSMMTIDEKQNVEKMWDQFQTNGIGALSDDFLKLYFSLEEKARAPINSTYDLMLTEFSRKGFKSFYLDLPKIVIDNPIDQTFDPTLLDHPILLDQKSRPRLLDQKPHQTLLDQTLDQSLLDQESDPTLLNPNSNQETILQDGDATIDGIKKRNDSGISVRDSIVWDNFSESGFKESSEDLTAVKPPSIKESISDMSKKDSLITFDNDKEMSRKSSTSSVISGRKSFRESIKSRKKLVKFRSFRKSNRTLSIDSRFCESENSFSETVSENDKEDWNDWDIISNEDLPITTHLAIETVDEIFPYVWMETTASDQGDRWGDWVFIEPRKGLVHECEWVMIEEKAQVFTEQQVTRTPRRRKMSAISTFTIPWIRGKGKSRPASKISGISGVSGISGASTVLPPPPVSLQEFNRARTDDNILPNYKFGRQKSATRITKTNNNEPIVWKNTTQTSQTSHTSHTIQTVDKGFGTLSYREYNQYETATQYTQGYFNDEQYNDNSEEAFEQPQSNSTYQDNQNEYQEDAYLEYPLQQEYTEVENQDPIIYNNNYTDENTRSFYGQPSILQVLYPTKFDQPISGRVTQINI